MLENMRLPPFDHLESDARSCCRRFLTIFTRERNEDSLAPRDVAALARQ